MQTGIPQLDQETYLSVKTLKDSAKVTRALQIAFDEAELGMKEQVELCGIPAPTFQEALRAEGQWTGSCHRRTHGYRFPGHHGRDSQTRRKPLLRARNR